jgi:hypothetical protein
MATLQSGQTISIQLAEGESYTVTPSGTAQVSTRGVSGSELSAPRTLTSAQTFGPYTEGGVINIACLVGTAFYAQAGGAVYQDPTTGALTGLDGLQLLPTAAERGPSVLKRGFPLLRAPLSATGYTAESGNITVAHTTRNNRRCLELTFAAVVGPHSMNFDIPSRAYSANISYVFEVENAYEWNGGDWRIGLFTDGTFATGVNYSQAVGAANAWNGTHVIAPMNSATAEWAAVGAGSFASTMTKCRLRFTRKASPTGTTRIWVYEVAENEGQSLPGIYIGADDGHMTWYTSGLPILEKYGFSSYLAYIADDQNGTTRMRDSVEWFDAIQRGHHAIVHGCKTGISSLRNYFASYAPYGSPQAAMAADIEYNRDKMVAAGLDPSGRGRRIYALPQGNHQPGGGAGDDTIADAMQDAGILMARRATVQCGSPVNGGLRGMAYYLPIVGHSYAGGSEATNITNIVARIQAEVAAGRSVWLMFHQIAAIPAISEEITAANLETIVAACGALVQSGAAKAGNTHDLLTELMSYESPVHMLT